MTQSAAAGIHPFVFVLGLAAAGVAGALTATWAGDTAASPTGTLPAAGDAGQLDEIERRLRELEDNRAAMPIQAEPRQPGEAPLERVAVPGETTDNDTLRGLQLRVARLEAAEAGREQAATERQQARERMRVERALAQKDRAANAAAAILNPGTAEKEKLRAWGQLRDSAETWTDALVSEMVRIGQSSTDAALRADVWRQADANGTHPLLVQPLINALLTDPEAKVREEAAETLEIYRGKPGVETALRQAMDNDQNEGVRRYAQRSLGRAGR